jgi:hypothetical protein
MNSKAIHELLESTAERLNWMHWSVGVLRGGIYYLEIETTSQYDEIPFDSEAELTEYVNDICVAR